MKRRTPTKEADLLRKVETAIEGVVRADPGMSWRDDSMYVKRQKYADNVVSHFIADESEPPVTRSWFRYGRTLVAAPSGPGQLGPGQTRPPQENGLKQASVEEMEAFLRSDECHPKLTKEWWTDADPYDFLEEYYRYQAPERFRSIYLKNLELRRIFEQTREDIANARSPFSDQVEGPIDYYDEIGTKVAEIQMELATTEELGDALVPFRDLTDLVEDAYMQLAKIRPGDLTGGHLSVIKEIDDFYDDVLWEFPASLMSESSATGPNQSWLVDKAETGIEDFQPEYEKQLGKLKQTISSEGLLPSVSDYDAPDDQVEAAIEDVMRVADKRDE